jgi:hypothetical protein
MIPKQNVHARPFFPDRHFVRTIAVRYNAPKRHLEEPVLKVRSKSNAMIDVAISQI